MYNPQQTGLHYKNKTDSTYYAMNTIFKLYLTVFP